MRLRRKRYRDPRTVPDLWQPVEGPALPDDSTVHLVLDLALRVGEVQLASGAGAADATATVMAVADAYGLPRTEVDVTFTSITVSCHRGTEAAPVTSLRVVRSRGLDYTRLAALENLIRRITDGDIRAADAYAELDRITKQPHPYPRWVATLAWAGMAGAVAFLVGGGPLLALAAALVTAVIDRVGRLLNRRALPFFFQQVVGGALATAAAALMYATDAVPEVRPSLLVATGIVVLLSGLSLVGAVQDAITGYNVTAAGRLMEIALLTAGLITGIALTLRAAVQFGVRTSIADPLPPLISDVPVQFAAGAVTSAFFALAAYAPLRALPIAAAAGAVGTGTYGLLVLTGTNVITCSAVAATVVGFGGAVVSRRLRTPPLVVAVAGMVPLLPGWTTYRGLYQLTVEADAGGLSTLVLAAGTALALASGVVLGEFLGRPVRTGLSRLERKLAGPRLSGPLRPAKRRVE
ncbi:threonine/serine exporter family protein [Saccharothrix mutabilis subsp. mutabilis]|uniref:Threonine/serine exporter family protein n=1 Tax=Saccharothrix mutabilis subsp. mutabilis TaxID=66855 RepID=A0ABN0U4C4_9PSEU